MRCAPSRWAPSSSPIDHPDAPHCRSDKAPRLSRPRTRAARVHPQPRSARTRSLARRASCTARRSRACPPRQRQGWYNTKRAVRHKLQAHCERDRLGALGAAHRGRAAVHRGQCRTSTPCPRLSTARADRAQTRAAALTLTVVVVVAALLPRRQPAALDARVNARHRSVGATRLIIAIHLVFCRMCCW